MRVGEFDRIMRSELGRGEAWDNDGIMLDLGGDIKKAAVALDAASPVIAAAESAGAQLLVTHHPLIFHPMDRVSDDSQSLRLIRCVRAGISVASYHTCLDIYAGGVNDCLCGALGIEDTTPFLPYGRVGRLQRPMSFANFIEYCSKRLNCKPFQLVDSRRAVSRVAVVSGGGKDEVRDAYLSGADTFLTGEASHDAMIDCAEYGINLICCGHFETENVVVPKLAKLINSLINDIEVITLGV